VEEILIDRRELILQHDVQMLQYFGIALHARHSDKIIVSRRSWANVAECATRMHGNSGISAESAALNANRNAND
jgi:hypothetical protein